MTPRRTLWIVLGLGLVLRLALLPNARGLETLVDENQFVSAALSIADGGPPRYTNPFWDEAHYPPLYPYLLGGVARVTGPDGLLFWARVLQSFASVLTAWLVYRIARATFDERTALWSCAAATFLPTLVAYSHYLFSETVFATLSCATAAILLGGQRSEGASDALAPGRALAAGLVAGLAALTRSLFFLQVLVVPLWILWRARGAPRRPWLAAAAFLGGLALIIGPWSVRNTLRYDRFLLIDTGAGNVLNKNWNMIDPWNQDVGLIGRYNRQVEEGRAQGIQRRKRFEADNIVDRNSGEIRLALAWLRDHPGLFARHCVIRAAELVNPTSWLVFRLRRGDYGIAGLGVEMIVWSVLLTTIAVLGLGLLGLALRPLDADRLLLAWVFLSGAGFAVLLMVISRYRMPLMPFLIPFAVDLARRSRHLAALVPAGRARPWRIGGALVVGALLLWAWILYVPFSL